MEMEPSGLSMMSSSTHFDPLPPPSPSRDDEDVVNTEGWPSLTNFDTDFVIECRKCVVKVPFHLFDQHRSWHARTNFIHHLRTVVKNELAGRQLSFEAGDLGCLVVLNYEREDQLWKKAGGGTEEDDQELRDFLAFGCQHLVGGLRYVDGLKYTIGNKFTSREEDGEFNFLNLDLPLFDIGFCIMAKRNYGPWFLVPKENYFELKCEDGWLWIKSKIEASSSSTTRVYLNGTPLGNNRELRVAFGDVINISIEDGKRGGKRGCDLILKAHSFEDKEKPVLEVSKALVEPLENTLIVQTILRCLLTTKVKDFRLVSPIWNEEALKVIKERGLWVTVCKSKDLSFGHAAHLMQMMQISNFVHGNLPAMQFPKWKMELPYFHSAHSLSDDETQVVPSEKEHVSHLRSVREDKILDDLRWLMGHQPHGVKILHLSGTLGLSPKSFQMYQVVLSGLKETLTTLIFVVELIYNPHSLALVQFDQLPALKSLKISLNGMTTSAEEIGIVRSLIKAFVPSVGSVQYLSLDNKRVEEAGVTALQILQEVCAHQLADAPKFTQLNTLVLRYSRDDVVNVIASLNKGTLQRLELFDLTPPLPFGIRSPFRRALTSHVESLTAVSLHFRVLHGDMKINFPERMQNLQSLTLRFELMASHPREVQVCYGPEAVIMDWMKYNQRFPSLVSLLIWPVKGVGWGGQGGCWPLERAVDTDWSYFTPILATFIGTGDRARGIQGNEQRQREPEIGIKTLDIPFLLDGKYHRMLDELETTFPNAAFPPSLVAARGEEVWMSSPEEAN